MTPIEIRNMALAHAIAYVEINVRDAGGSSELSDVRDAAREFEAFLMGSTALTPASPPPPPPARRSIRPSCRPG
jgi:hypothetical protein